MRTTLINLFYGLNWKSSDGGCVWGLYYHDSPTPVATLTRENDCWLSDICPHYMEDGRHNVRYASVSEGKRALGAWAGPNFLFHVIFD